MYKWFSPYALLCLAMLGGCDIIKLGGNPAPIIPDLDQKTAQGVVRLFKAELDSNNVAAATRVLARENRQPYLAIEKYEKRYEIERLGRRIAHRNITGVKVDTLSSTSQRLHTEFSYIKEVTFTTAMLDNLWYIVSIEELPESR